MIGLVAAREVRERVRTRLFRVGTLVILLALAAAIVLPVLHRSGRTAERVGVVGTVTASLRSSLRSVAYETGEKVSIVVEPSPARADAALRSGALDLAVLAGGRRLVVDAAVSPTDTSTSARFALGLAGTLGTLDALEAVGVAPSRIAALEHPAPVPIGSLTGARRGSAARITALYGLILMFVLLSQYGMWVLMGVVEEKSSRVVEVLLAVVRPSELLAGKVLGIGLVALGQATLIVAVALGLADAVGSPLVRGAEVGQVLAVLVWLVVGYAFYCWVYAAAGSLAERQEHVQSLAFPLQLPILLGYIASITALGASSPSTFVKVLAYLPPTAPFAIPVLVATGAVTGWQFGASVAFAVGATFGVARLASTVYARAVLRTGRRIGLREVLGPARTAVVNRGR